MEIDTGMCMCVCMSMCLCACACVYLWGWGVKLERGPWEGKRGLNREGRGEKRVLEYTGHKSGEIKPGARKGTSRRGRECGRSTKTRMFSNAGRTISLYASWKSKFKNYKNNNKIKCYICFIHTHLQLHTHMHTHTCTCTHTHAHMYMCIHTCACTCTFTWNTCTRAHTYMQTPKHTHTDHIQQLL